MEYLWPHHYWIQPSNRNLIWCFFFFFREKPASLQSYEWVGFWLAWCAGRNAWAEQNASGPRFNLLANHFSQLGMYGFPSINPVILFNLNRAITTKNVSCLMWILYWIWLMQGEMEFRSNTISTDFREGKMGMFSKAWRYEPRRILSWIFFFLLSRPAYVHFD